MAAALLDRFVPVDLGHRRVLHPGKFLWARAIGWMIALILAVGLAFGPSMEALLRGLPKEPAYQFLAHGLGCLIILGTYALLVRLGEDRTPGELSIRAAPFDLFAGGALGVLTFSAVMAILVGFQLYDLKYLGAASAWRGAGLALESGVFEEVLVRGIVLRLAWRAFGPWPAFVISALLFGVGHIGNPGATLFTTACVAIEAGVALAAFYALTGRLWLSIGFHAAWNFTQGYLYGAAVSGSDFGGSIARSTPRAGFPDWLTGGAFGPEASLPALTICSAIGIAALWLAWRAGRFSRPAPETSPAPG
ncbi:MAG: type II CAAX endopeptidase family protein [Caulobacter sp.]|nr:type II CAAX endopeptidase family protein [Caulobacter sp.]